MPLTIVYFEKGSAKFFKIRKQNYFIIYYYQLLSMLQILYQLSKMRLELQGRPPRSLFAAAKEVFGSIRNHSLILAIADFACIAAVRVI